MELRGRQAMLLLKESATKQEINREWLRVEGLRIAFDIERTLSIEPNSARIEVYNLNRDHRTQYASRPLLVELYAGYGTMERLFVGDIRRAFTEREGADLITRFEVGDAEVAFQEARVNIPFNPGATFERVFRTIVSQAKVNAKSALEKLKKGDIQAASKAFARGWVASGRTLDELTRLAKVGELELSVQDGELQVLDLGKATTEDPIRLNPLSGLLGEPSVTETGWLSCAALLIPGLRPGRGVVVESDRVKGVFRAERCRYVGDTHGQQWLVEIEGRPISV